MNNIFTILLLICCSFPAVSQLTNDAVGSRSLGVANASVNFQDVWSIHNNVAGLAEFKGTQAAVGFNNRFGIDGFNSMTLAAAHQMKFGTAGMSVKRFGDNLYNESIFGFGVAHRIDFVSLGLKANMMQVAIDQLGSKMAVALEFGGLVHINDELTLGANIFNFNQAKLADFNDERFSTVLKAGLTYNPNSKLFLTIEAEKDVEYKQNIKAGLEYFLIEKLAFRIGFSTLNQVGSFGLGLVLNKFNIDYAFSHHGMLGLSNGISINYLIGQVKETEISDEAN